MGKVITIIVTSAIAIFLIVSSIMGCFHDRSMLAEWKAWFNSKSDTEVEQTVEADDTTGEVKENTNN